jgi:flagellar biosynthesis GTPase FlhF
MSDNNERTFRGRSLAEVLPRIREELGEHAVAVRVRHGRTGGVGGFFAQRCVEVDARPGSRFDSALAEAQVSTERFVPAEVPSEWPELVERAAAEAQQPSVGEILGEPRARKGASALAALFQPDAAPFAAEPEPEPAAFEPDPTATFEPDPLPVPVPRVERGVVHAPAAMPAPMVPVDPTWPEMAVAVHQSLTGKGMDPELVADIVGEAVDHLLPFSSAGSLRPLVAGQLARCLPPVPRRRPGGLTIGFVGAGGSGKTRCTARLALAYANRGGRPVACLTLRPKDRGVELMSDVSAAGVAVHATDDVADARRFLDRVGQHAIVVVDTPGVSPRAEAELRRLAAELRQLQLDECHLTLPATMSPAAAEELLRGTRSLGVDALAITHVDETEHLGTAIGAAIDADLPISYVGRGPDARGTLRPALVQALALELVG